MIPHVAIADPVAIPEGQGRLVLRVIAGLALAAGLATAVGAFADTRQFAFSYLTGFAFVVSLGVGSLFWIMIHHLTDAGWSVVLRRFYENFARALPWLALAFLPIVAVLPRLYEWTRPLADFAAHPETQKLLASKRAWLNVPFFLLRAGVYLAAWGVLAQWLARASARQDRDGDPAETGRMQRLSAPGMIVLAITTTFATFDWIMSLDFRWYSTMLGVYFWAGSILGSLATLIVTVLGFQAAGWLRGTITVEHRHDLGKLLLGFVVFWAYIAFCQYFLIWYANLPEETVFYLARRAPNGLNRLSWALAIGHFAVPFALLLPHASKRNPLILGFVAAWLLVFHYLDLYWLVMPNMPGWGRPHWLDPTALVALVAACAWVVGRACLARPLVPVGDPRLGESLAFRNA